MRFWPFSKTSPAPTDPSAQVAAPAVVASTQTWSSGTMMTDDARSAFFGAGYGPLPAVTEQTARSISVVHACVNLIAGVISTLPLNVYSRATGGVRSTLPDDPFWWILNEEASPRWSASAFWVRLLESKLYHGDGFARIRRGPAGQVVGLEPLHPNRVSVVATPDGERLVYVVAPDPTVLQPSAGVSKFAVYDQDDIIHVSGPGFNGLRSPSPLSYSLRMVGGIAMATQDYAARFFSNSARPDYALVTPNQMGAEAVAALKQAIDERYSAIGGQSHRPMVLTGGLDIKPITMTIEDVQLLQVRAFQVEEVARSFGVPPFMVGHTEKNTSFGSGIESMGQGFKRYALGSQLVAIHNEFNRKLIRNTKKVFEFDTFELERADMKSLFTAFRMAIGRAGEEPILTVDEVRQYLNREPRGQQPGDRKNAPKTAPRPPGE